MKVLFVCSGNAKSGISPIVSTQGESLSKLDVDLDYFPIAGRGVGGYAKSSLRLRKHLEEASVDVLHAHYGISAWAALLARRKEKLVVSFMGDDIIGSNKSDGSITRTSLSIARINVFLARKYYDHAIVKSEAMLDRFGASHVSLIPNGVDLALFKPTKKAEARNRLRIDPGIKLVIFASDPKRMEKNIPLAKKALEIAASSALLLPIYNHPHACMPDFFNAADATILTSFHEGSPNVIKEAMACNCPIVSTDVGDVRWVLGDTEGCYVTSYSLDDVASKMSLALEFAEKKEQTNGRERIIALGLDSETVARKLVKIYEKVLGICAESAE